MSHISVDVSELDFEWGEEMSLLSSLLGGGGDSHSNFGAVLVCCCITCILRLPCWVNRALQWGHSYGFSPVWLNLWRFKWNESANALPHMSHENGRSPVCDLNIIFRIILTSVFGWSGQKNLLYTEYNWEKLKYTVNGNHKLITWQFTVYFHWLKWSIIRLIRSSKTLFGG